MPGVVVNTGLAYLGGCGVNKTTPGDLVLCLYKSNTTITSATVLADLTEADFIGYSPITTIGALWDVTTGNPAVMTYAQQTFISSAAQATQDVQGYFVKQGTTLIGAEPFEDAPNPITNNGDAIKVTPTLNLAAG